MGRSLRGAVKLINYGDLKRTIYNSQTPFYADMKLLDIIVELGEEIEALGEKICNMERIILFETSAKEAIVE